MQPYNRRMASFKMMVLSLIILLTLPICSFAEESTEETINITYVHVNLPPYENITKSFWQFELGSTKKSLNGIISRSINYISKKHCPRFKFLLKEVDSTRDLMKYLQYKTTEDLKKELKGDHFIFGPISMNAYMYYKMQYSPKLFTWQPNFVKSQGMVTVQRIEDVNLSQRILRAIKRSGIIIIFVLLALPTMSIILWTFDRKWNKVEVVRPVTAILDKMYLCMVTLTTVGYGDVVPLTSVGKVFSVLWMIVSIISVSCLTSIITSDMVDSSFPLHNQQVAVVKDSWEEFLARLLVNRHRSSTNIIKRDNYTELLNEIQRNTSLKAALIDHNILSMLQDDLAERELAATFIIPNSENNMGIGYHHPTENETMLMNELMQCLALEPEFKEMNLNMLVPFLEISTIVMTSSHHWMIIMLVIFLIGLLIGIVIEILQRRTRNNHQNNSSGSREHMKHDIDESNNMITKM